MNRTPVGAAFCLCLAAVLGSTVAAVSQELPRYSTPQDVPCPDQPRSVRELVDAFDRGQMPEPSQVTGTWVAIGFVAIPRASTVPGLREVPSSNGSCLRTNIRSSST